ncbi:MAG: hypothetical protein K2Q01_08965, partial [Rickettsiales bacterium]|nr:hypothetical protein [Rickettsiales bacterium]
PNAFLREFADSSMTFMLMFWIADVNDSILGPKSDVMMTILKKFSENSIEIPYPQRVTRVVAGVPITPESLKLD